MRHADAVLVLGMHRSGTSAATGALERLGLYLGNRLVPAAEDNPSGYFEHADAVAVNEGLLDALDRSWDDVRALPDGWRALPAADTARERIRAEMLPGLFKHVPWALKDPRLCRLLPLWRTVLEEGGIRTAALLVVRHPDEVAASLHARDKIPAPISRVLWLRYVFEAVQNSVGLPRAVLSYAALLEAPMRALHAIHERLGLPLPRAAPRALDDFLKTDARHHIARAAEAVSDEWHALALRTYAALASAEPDWTQMDELQDEFHRLHDRDAWWIELVGATLRAADIRRRSLGQRAIAREAELHEALRAATMQASERLETMCALRRELDATQISLEQVKAQALERLETMHGLRLQLDATEEALARVEALSLERLRTMQTLRAQLDATEDGLARAEALSLERLGELERISREFAETAQARERAEATLAAIEASLTEALARLTRIETSWWWRAAQSVRRLFRRGG
ncbi:MAG TPA: hypothetical protein VEY50_11300 [Lysobacter sp.]|nr:hypothetical protein [Lysobacter sp.]